MVAFKTMEVRMYLTGKDRREINNQYGREDDDWEDLTQLEQKLIAEFKKNGQIFHMHDDMETREITRLRRKEDKEDAGIDILPDYENMVLLLKYQGYMNDNLDREYILDLRRMQKLMVWETR